ncbi:MAG: SDR family NAD(P)-dependent oxidoreductase [Gaiellaceae bacterium]
MAAVVNLSGNRFLVTGGSGFIGSHVVDGLVDAGAAEVVVFDQAVRSENLERALESGRVTVVEGDVTDPGRLAEAMAGIGGVFHMSVLPLGACVENPRLCHEVNVTGTLNVLEAAHVAGVRKVVYSSASSVYGDTPETMDESHPLNARTMYGASKAAGEFYVRAFNDMYGLEYVTLRYMNVYGPRQEGGLVVAVTRRILSGEPPGISGDGSQSFDFVHVADVAGANLHAMASDVSDDAFNVGSGTEVTVREIVEKLLEITESDVEPEYRTDERVLMMRRVGSNTRAKERLGWEAGRDLDDGLRDVVDSLRAAQAAR